MSDLGRGRVMVLGAFVAASACVPFLGPLPDDGGTSAGSTSIDGDRPDASGTGGATTDGRMSGDAASHDATNCLASQTPLRLIAPLSTSFVTSLRPTLKWEGPSSCGTVIDLCRDPACAQVVATVSTSGPVTSARPTTDLPGGAIFWRARSGDAMTGVWSFFVGKGTAVDSSGGTFSDFNGDGRSDVAVLADGGAVLVYYGAPTGFDASPTHLPEIDASSFALAEGTLATPGDISGDGISDLVVATTATSADPHARLYVFLGSPAGVTGSPAQIIEMDAQVSANAPVLKGGMDINSDGYGDFLVLTDGEYIQPVFGGPSALLGKTIYLGGPVASANFAVCDLDGDGNQDFALLLESPTDGPTPRTFRGTGAGFVPGSESLQSHGTDAEAFHDIVCADVEDDGYPDLVLSAPQSSARGVGAGDVVVFRNSVGTIASSRQPIAGTDTDQDAYSGSLLHLVGDMNGDGVDEIAIGSSSDIQTVRIAFKALSGVGADTVEIGGTPDVGGGFGAAIASGDFDGDGLADLLVSSPTDAGGRLTLFKGDQLARVLSPSTIHLDAPAGMTMFGKQLSTAR